MIKAIFIMREDLEISAPKLAIQIGHGNDFIHLANSRDLAVVNWHQQHNPFYVRWITECNRRKIVVRAKNEAKLKKIAKIADENSIQYNFIVDAGYTEFDGETTTGLVIHPIDEELLPKAITRLRLL